MRPAVAIAAVLGALVGAGAMTLGSTRRVEESVDRGAAPEIDRAAPTPREAPVREVASPTAPEPTSPPTLERAPSAPRSGADATGTLAERMTVIEARLDELARAVRHLSEHLNVPPVPLSEAELAAAAKRYDPEELRRLFTDRLDEMQRKLDQYPRSSGGKPDIVMQSHQMDIDRARQQLAEARDADALVRLSQGEFKKSFALPR